MSSAASDGSNAGEASSSNIYSVASRTATRVLGRLNLGARGKGNTPYVEMAQV